ncbi:alpha/beta fold hydrolase [Natrialbaceae archaeon A-CW2]|uniref:alpha/beta fold hydrolase n=1 Tax=Natronosalvus amylolyticus TaxID=2961994 RepID=UPI0020C9B12C|nr:alpha/beta hydrolase [Natronosalvus amylolyticus]
MHTVSHHGRDTAYEYADRDAPGAPICFVHGSGGSSTVWKSQHRIADKHPVVAVDLSGHGESDDIDAEPGYTTLSAYADDVIAVYEATDSRVLAGNSLGGAVVMHILLERSEEIPVGAAILTGTGARLGVLEDIRRWLAENFERAVDFLHDTDRFFHDPDPRLQALSKAAMRECGREVTQRDFLTCHEFDVRGQLGTIDVPALALHGEYDQLTPPDYHEYLADQLPAGTRQEIPDAAHLAMLEQPAAFNQALLSFLEDIS